MDDYKSPFQDWTVGRYLSYRGVEAQTKFMVDDPHWNWQQGVDAYVQTGERTALDKALEYVTADNPPDAPKPVAIPLIENNMKEPEPNNSRMFLSIAKWAGVGALALGVLAVSIMLGVWPVVAGIYVGGWLLAILLGR